MKKFFKRAGFVLLPIIVLLLVVILKWESIAYFALRKIIQHYGDRSYIAIEIGGISGKPFSETTMDTISISPAGAAPQPYDFKAETLTCTYSLWDLKEGYELFLKGLNCSASSPEFTYDFRSAAPQDRSTEKPEQFFVPAVLPGIDVHNGTVILTDSSWGTEMRGINSKLSSAAATHELQLEVENFRFSREGVTKIEKGFTSSLRYSGAKLFVDSFEMGEDEISATGTVDLARLDKGDTVFAADLAFAENHLNISGSLENRLLQMRIKTEDFDTGELQKRLGGSDWDFSGKIRGETDFTVNLEPEHDITGSVVLDVQEGQVHGVGIDALNLTGSFDNNIIYVSSAEIRTPGNKIIIRDVSVPMPLLQDGDILSIIGGTQAVFNAEIKDVESLLTLIQVEEDVLPEVVIPNSLIVQGYLGKGTLHLEDGRAVTTDSSLTINRGTIPIPATEKAFESLQIDIAARFQAGNLQEVAGLFGDIPVNGQVAADISVTGSMKEPEVSVSLAGEHMSIEELQVGSLSLQAEVTIVQEKLGEVKSVQFEITELTQSNDSGSLAIVSPATGTWQDDTFSMKGDLQVDGKGNISLGLDRIPDKDITVEITTRNLTSGGWLGIFIDNRYFFHGADIEAVLKGLPKNPQVKLAGSIAEAGGTGVPFPLAGSFALQYSPKGIEISEFTWKSHDRNQLTITGHLPFDPVAPEPFLDNDMDLKGHIDFPALEDIGVFLEPWGISRGSVAVSMDVTGSWNRPEGHIFLKAAGIEPPKKLKRYMDSTVDFSCDVAALGGAIVLQAATLDSSVYSAQATGSWRHGISVKELLQNRKAELRGELAGDAILKLKDLNFLRLWLPWLRRLEGDMQGELRVSGSVTDPAITGSFSFRDGELSHSFNFPALSAVNLLGDFDEHSITIKKMQAEVGGSPVNLSGNINKEGETVEVNLHADGKNLLLFRNNDMRMRGDVQLDVSGPLQHLSIKGSTGLTGGYYTKNFDFLSMIGTSSAPVSEGVSFLFSFPDPPLRDAALDIKITTIEPFRIRNNLIRGVLRPELSLKGTGELPFLTGTVYIDPSRILLPSGRLQVESGLLRFLEEEPDRPQLDLLAQSKILGYDINVVTRGPLDDPEITLSSSPALPNDDLLLLLLTGQPPKQDVVGGVRSRGTTNVMVYLGRDFLNKWLEDESSVSDDTILDRFNLDYGRGVTKSGDQTVEATFRLSGQETGKEKVYYLSAEKDRYDAYNYGLKLVFRFE